MHGMCWSVRTACIELRDNSWTIDTKIFLDLLKPRLDACGWWGDEWGEDRQECRILGLLLVAAIAESEGK